MLHAFPFSAKLWEPVATQLASKNLFVVTPNFRGCGDSPLGLVKPSLEVLARDTFAVIEKLKIQKPFISGISLGGYVAMKMLSLEPSFTRGLILLDTKASPDSLAVKENRLQIAKQMRDEENVSIVVEQILTSVLGLFTKENRPQVIHQVKNWILEANPTTIAWLQEAMANRAESFTALAQFDGPSLLIRGTQDEISSAEDFELMVKNLRQVTSIEIKNAGHLPPIEDASSTAQIIGSWLNDITSANC
jgi:pimeloyl-ACP methyl ester carboxylesterase